MSERDRASRWGAVALLLAITGLGLWFRWAYVRDVSFFVDEYLQVRAATRILARGVPLLPSGNFYSHGLLLSYLVAGVIGLGGEQPWLMRLPVLLLSTAAIPLTFWLGGQLSRRSSPDRSTGGAHAAGLIAAALLAFAPEAILWGGRVRMYAPLQFFVLLATGVFYLWVVRQRDRALYRLLFVAAYWACLFSHAEAMLLLPVWGLWALVQRGWRWCLRPANLATFVLSSLSVVVEILLRGIGPPVQAWVSPGVLEPLSRQYLGAALDWAGVQKVVEPLFLTPARLPLTVVTLVGLGILLVTWGQPRLRRSLNPEERRGLAYLYALLLPILALLLFVVDPSWKSPRFGLMLLPHFFLIAGLLLTWLGRWLEARSDFRRGWIGILAAVLLVGVVSWPPAVAATRESVPGYDWAFAYVKEQQQPGDVVITFLCPAAFLHLGRCDYLAIPADFSGFAFQKEGRWVSGWDEVPIVDSADSLRQALATAPRAWFVVDEGRFARRYEADFLEAVWEGMELLAAEREMLVFRSPSAPAGPAAEIQDRRADFEGGVRLLGYALEGEEWAPGDEMAVVLHWQARSRIAGDDTVSIQLLDEAGQVRGQADGPPLGGLYPTPRWPPGLVLADRHTLPLPLDLEPGRYRLEMGLYDAGSSERVALDGEDARSVVLDYVWIGARPPATAPHHRLEAEFGDAIRLLGCDLSPAPPSDVTAGSPLTVTLYWQAVAGVDDDYTVFVHLVDAGGQIQGQGDGPPLAGHYPTSFWAPGEVLRDVHTLAVGAEAPAGEYHLLVGLHRPEDGMRLPVTKGRGPGEDRVLVASLAVR
jgi:4-amino-4-deoxy-L-arabinose transferase-like glycosyltransferase